MLMLLRRGPRPYVVYVDIKAWALFTRWVDHFKAWAPSLSTISWHPSLKLQYKNGWLCYHFPHGQLRGGPRLGTISLGCMVCLLQWNDSKWGTTCTLVNKPFIMSTILSRERERQNGQLIPAIFKFQRPECIFWDRNETETKQKPFSTWLKD